MHPHQQLRNLDSGAAIAHWLHPKAFALPADRS